MERHQKRQAYSPRRGAVFGRADTHHARPAQRRRRRYQFERLEDRLLMNADNPLADAVMLTADDVAVLAADIAKTTDAPDATNVELPERFQSAVEFEAWLVEAAVAQWGHLFGQSRSYFFPGWNWGYLPAVDGIGIGLAVPRMTVANDVVALSRASYSTTNIQVEGVDEADVVETDGHYLYILSGQDLVIVEAGIGEELRIASRIHFDEKPVGMYLSGDRLAIVSSAGSYDLSLKLQATFQLLTVDGVHVPTVGPSTTTVTVLDITDRAAPTMVQKSRMDGQLVSSRVVDGELRLVLRNTLNLPAPIARPVENEQTATIVNGELLAPVAIDDWYPYSATQYVYETQEEYLARVKEEILKSAMPGLEILGPDGEVFEQRALVGATDVYRPEHALNQSLTTIATFDLMSNEAGPAATATVLTGQSTQVYSTAESLYLFSPASYDFGISSRNQTTRIHKFDFDAETHSIALAARGSVEGTLLNQFAADEHDGYLRVVTTPIWGSGQSVFVLKQVGKRLEVAGSVDGLAPGELIYSVRFMAERAFLVTYRKVDPLFALDLSEPTDPRVLGELKVPGYSDYLQPIDEHHLLAIGRGADEATGLFQELQVSIFNIADLTDPQLAHRYSFDGGRSIATPATGDRWQRGDGDHHAVSYFADAGVFALPIYHTGESGWWWNGIDTLSSLEAGQGGLQVFQIDVTTGFTPTGLIQHDTLVERSVRIGEYLFAISSGTVTVHELIDPTIELGSLNISAEEGAPLTELAIFRVPVAEAATLSLPDEPVTTDADFALPPLPQAVSANTPPLRARRLAAHDVFSSIDELLLASRVRGALPSRPAPISGGPFEEALAEAAGRNSLGFALEDSLAADLCEPLAAAFVD